MSGLKTLFTLLVVISLIIGGCVYVGKQYYETHTTTITVENMYIDNSGDKSHYMVASTDGRVFEADNSVWKGQYSIDKEWAYVNINGTYEVKYFGWDSQSFFGDWYLIIYDFEQVEASG